jgi:uncharacterized membrane protein YkvI
MSVAKRATPFQRLILPSLAFKAVVIGGGYATGREFAEFFMPSGPQGGILGITLAAVVFSIVCAITFLFAWATQSYDYRTFFRNLLGPGWVVFDASYLIFILIVLSVYGAAAGEIGVALFHWPVLIGTLLLILGIAGIVAYGNEAVERLFGYVTILIYGVYITFIALALTKFSSMIAASFHLGVPARGWVANGLTYSGYQLLCAIVILPVTRHLKSAKDAIVAGALCGPVSMIPGLLYYLSMLAFYPQIQSVALPSDYLLQRFQIPSFHYLFQLMLFFALLESATGTVHAINERVASIYREKEHKRVGKRTRITIAMTMLVLSIFVATKFGLVALIAKGYRFFAYDFIAIYIIPLLTFGVWLTIRKLRAAPIRLESAPE